MDWTRRNFVKLFPGLAALRSLPFSSSGLAAALPPQTSGIGASRTPPWPPVRLSGGKGQTYKRLGYKIYILDFQFSDLDPTTLAKADPAKYADAMVEMGVDSLLVYANNVYGISFFHSQYGPQFKNISDNFLGEYLAACRERKIKTVLYHAVFWQEYQALQHPEWIMLDAKSGKIKFQGNGVEGGVHYLCLNSPFRQLYMKQVKEIGDRYAFDSWFVDEFFFHRSLVCYNPFCLEKWKQRTGSDLPRPLPEKLFPAYLDFMVDTYHSFYKEIKEQLKSSGREASTTHNFGLDYTNDDYVIMESNPMGFDFYQMSARTKFCRAQANGRELQMIPHRGNMYTDYIEAPLPQLTWQSALATSHNAAVMWADQANVDGTLDRVAIQSVRQAFRATDRIIPKVRGTVPYAEIAVLASERSFNLSDYDDYTEYYACHKLLTDLHWPFNVINEGQLDDLVPSATPLLIVPRIQYLSAPALGSILRFMTKGGNLFFCGQCAVFDEYGKPHPQRNLSLVSTHDTGYPTAYVKTLFSIDDARLKAADISTVEGAEDLSVLATLIEPTVTEIPGKPFKDTPYPGKVTHHPVIVAGTNGKGRFAYAGYRFFREYLSQNVPVIGQAFTRIVGEFYQPAVWVKAPSVVEAVYNQTGNELRISLISAVTSRPSGGSMFGDPNQRGFINIVEVIPIAGIAIHVRGRVGRATDMDGRQLRISATPDSSAVHVPRLDQYDVISLEMA